MQFPIHRSLRAAKALSTPPTSEMEASVVEAKPKMVVGLSSSESVGWAYAQCTGSREYRNW